MARPREFDEGEVLDAAVGCFWSRGFEATSMRDLSVSMGIAGASLYNAFGDKRALYRRALERYLDNSVRERIGRLEASLPPRAAIGAFLDEIIARSVADPQHRGCMLVNAALDTAPHDAATRALVVGELAALEAFFRRCVVAGQADGSIPAGRAAEDMARLLLGVLLGIRVLARTQPDRALLEGVARPALSLLEPKGIE